MGTYISSNKASIRTVESDAEQLHRVLVYHNELESSDDPSAAIANINSFNTVVDKTILPHLMHSSETLKLLLRLLNFGNHFHLSPPMTKAWVGKHLMATAGGVSRLLVIDGFSAEYAIMLHQQFIIKYASYSLDQWSGLFSPTILYDVDGNNEEQWGKYQNACSSTTPTINKRHALTASSTWSSLTSSETTSLLNLLPNDVFSSIDALAADMLADVAHFCAVGDDTWDSHIKEYMLKFTSIMLTAFTNINSSTPERAMLKSGILRKLEWISFNHGEYHYAPVLPLITPNVLICIAQAFQLIPNALAEVSILKQIIRIRY